MNEEKLHQKKETGYLGIIVSALIGFIALVAVGVAILMLFSGSWYFAELINSFRLQVSLGVLTLAILLWVCGFKKWGAAQGLFALFLLYPIMSVNSIGIFESIVCVDQAIKQKRELSSGDLSSGN